MNRELERLHVINFQSRTISYQDDFKGSKDPSPTRLSCATFLDIKVIVAPVSTKNSKILPYISTSIINIPDSLAMFITSETPQLSLATASFV